MVSLFLVLSILTGSYSEENQQDVSIYFSYDIYLEQQKDKELYPNGEKVGYEYDDRGSRTALIYPDGNKVS